MDEGYIKISRKFFSSETWEAARTYSECEAWLDLIQSARFDATQPETVGIGGRNVTWGRGQYPASIRFLANRWQWGSKRVRSFLETLKKKGMITTDDSQGVNVITLVNYDKYNGGNREAQPTDRESTRYADLGHTPDIAKGTLNTLNINELRDMVTQLITQALEKFQNEGHSEGTNKKKGKKDISLKESLSNESDEKSAPQAARPEAVDYKKLVEFFNAETHGVFGVLRQPLSDRRKAMVRARIAEHGKECFLAMIQTAIRSDFLRGQNPKGWRATFDWLIKPTNFEKVVSGNYDNKPKTEQYGNKYDRRGRIETGSASSADYRGAF